MTVDSTPSAGNKSTEVERPAASTVSSAAPAPIVPRIERLLLISALVLLGAACFIVVRPFLSAVLWAAILALTTWPIFCRLRDALGGRPGLAALLMTSGFLLVLVVPLALGGLALAQSAEPWLDTVRGWIDNGLPDPPAWVAGFPVVGDWLHAKWTVMSHDGSRLARELKPLMEPARVWGLAAARSLGEGVMTLALSALIVYFFWRDGAVIADRVRRMAERVAGPRALQLADVAHGTIRGTVYGILGTALAQGLLAAVGFAIAGVPSAALLGVGTFFLSAVPVGPPLIWVPAAFWLYQTGATGWAIFLVVWGVAVVSSVDNFLKPLLISRGSNLPFVLVLLGVFGGVLAFGFVGIFLGPTLLAVAFRLLDEWSAERAKVAA